MSNRYGWFVTCMAVAFAPVPATTVMADRLSDTVTAADGTAVGITNAAGNSFKRASALFFYARALCGALSGGLAPPRSGFVLVPEGIVADDGTNKQRG